MNALLLTLASQMPPAESNWAPIVLMIIIGAGFGIGNVVLSTIIGPRRSGAVKGTTYESGMVPVGDTHKRFNVRFYIVAMIFLVIDVEIVFFYPFATLFAPTVRSGRAYPGSDMTAAAVMLISMAVFVAILLLAYVYAWGKGVFRWD
jgi:NADH-quinone oxidoreductase subunit A